MAAIDELVTIIRFDMPASSKRALGYVDSAVSSLTDKIKSLGIVTTITSGIMAAWSINAANSANELNKSAQAAGLDAEELQSLASVYKSVGGEARNAAQDAKSFKLNTGMDLDASGLEYMTGLISGLSETQAVQWMEALGYSQDLVNVLLLENKEREKRLKYGKENHALTKEEISQLIESRNAYTDFFSTIGTISGKIQSSLSPIITPVLKRITDAINENQDAIKKAVTETVNYIIDMWPIISEKASQIWGNITEGWNSVKNAIVSAWNEIESMTGWLEKIMPSDDFMEKVKSSISIIRDSIADIFNSLSQSIDDGALSRIYDLLDKISSSDAAKKFKEISESIASIGWDAMEVAFIGISKAAGSALEIMEGFLKIIDGIASAEIEQVVEGLQQIGYALINVIESVINKVIEKLQQRFPRIFGESPGTVAGRYDNSGLISEWKSKYDMSDESSRKLLSMSPMEQSKILGEYEAKRSGNSEQTITLNVNNYGVQGADDAVGRFGDTLRQSALVEGVPGGW